MDDAKLAIVGKVLGVLQILIAVFYLDLNDWNQIVVSALLFLGGVLMLTADVKSEFIRKFRGVLSYLTIVFAIAFIIKLLTVG